MGEAKRRGTFEERKAAAIERDGMTKEDRKKYQAAASKALRKEYQRRHAAAHMAAGLIPPVTRRGQ